MIEPPIDERYESAAVKDSLTTDERTTAEETYTRRAFDYERNPVGSRDWTLFWSGWCARATQTNTAQPPCGADGAERDGVRLLALKLLDAVEDSDVDGLTVNDVEGENWFDARNRVRALLASQPAAPVAHPLADLKEATRGSELGVELLRRTAIAEAASPFMADAGSPFAAEAAPVAQVAQAEGFVLVPVEPDVETINRIRDAFDEADHLEFDAIYRAMVLAAAQGATTDGGA